MVSVGVCVIRIKVGLVRAARESIRRRLSGLLLANGCRRGRRVKQTARSSGRMNGSIQLLVLLLLLLLLLFLSKMLLRQVDLHLFR